jgi:hypothetical protein
MTLWVDEYRPTSFDELTFNTEEALQLQNLVLQFNLPALIYFF